MEPTDVAAPPRRLLLDGLAAALAATGGRASVRRRLSGESELEPRFAFAVGKAAASMMAGAFDALGDTLQHALVVTKHGHAGDQLDPAWPVDIVESSHPVPDESCLTAGRALGAFVDAIPAGADVLALMSGGASALVEILPDGFTDTDLARVNEYLLGAGHPIGVVNRVRKRISLIKGGRLGQRVAPRRALNLAISDVPDDDPKVIGSGLLVPHTSDDLAIAGVALPAWLAEMVRRAPPPPGPEVEECVRTELVARPADARSAAAASYRSAGIDVVEHDRLLEGDAIDVGRRIGESIAKRTREVHVWASETTVMLPPDPGRGGRCQSLALAAALAIRDRPGLWVLAAGTDGTDGPGEDAGALVDGATVARGIAAGLDPERSLRNADAGTFLESSGDLVHTGPTGTNVMDLVVAMSANREFPSGQAGLHGAVPGAQG